MPLKNRALILAKVESSYGVDASPAAGTDAVLCEPPSLSLVSKKLERNNVRSFMGKNAPVNVGEGLKIAFTTELKGSGTAVDDPPEIAALFRACNMTETINPGASVDYEPNSAVGIPDGAESITIYYNQDGILHKLLGCRGTFSMSLKAGEYGKINWEFTGIYAGPVDQAISAGSYATAMPPVFKAANFSIDSYAAVIESLEITLGNEIAKRPSANAATGILEWFIAGRAPTGKIDPEVVALATKDFWNLWETSKQMALSATLGDAASNKCVITAPAVVLDGLGYEEREKLLIYGASFGLHPTASGDDEIKFSFQ